MARNTVPRQKSLGMPDVTNPFVHELELSLRDKIQIAIMSVTIAPIRLLLVVLLLLLAWPFAALAVAFRSEEDKLKPISGWRLYANWPLVYIGRAIILVAGFCMWPTKGERATAREAPLLLAAPHSGLFDIIIYFLELPMSSPVSRKENGDIPIFGSNLTVCTPP